MENCGRMSAQEKNAYWLPAAIVGIASVLFLVFVYGYPRLFPLIEASHPDHFEKNVANALDSGNIRKALKIAHHATLIRRDDPMAYTVYGKVLLESGDTDAALRQLAKAIGGPLEHWPLGQLRERSYFAPARLTLGTYYLEQGKSIDAIENFELARAHVAPKDFEYGDFDKTQYQAYSALGLWGRALEFGTPSDQELDYLDNRDLVRIARVFEGERNWKLATRIAGRLLRREGQDAEAYYFMGRAALALEEYEASLVYLEKAVLNGHAHAAFFLGMALEKAGKPARALQAFLRTPSGDLYRAFALANAFTLLEKFPEIQQNRATPTRPELLGQLDREIAEMLSLPRPTQYDKYRRLTPLAVTASSENFEAGGRFPILVLWEDGRAPSSGPTPLSLAIPDSDGSLLVLKRDNNIVQLQWVGNLVNWESVERLPEGAGPIPGWIDTAHDWFGLRTEHAPRIQKDDAGNSFLGIRKLTWFYSLPVRVRDGVGYLLAGRVKDPNNKANLSWQSLDNNENVLFESHLSEQTGSGVWVWQAGYMRSRLHWGSLRVSLDFTHNSETVAFDDVMLVEINEPDPTLLDGEI